MKNAISLEIRSEFHLLRLAEADLKVFKKTQLLRFCQLKLV